jgi:DNA-binding NarL/FixJ family response regulator
MRICVHVTSLLASEALKDFLISKGHDGMIPHECAEASPEIILVDVNTVDSEFTSRYPNARVVMLDTGFKKERILTLIGSERLRAVIPQDASPSIVLQILENVQRTADTTTPPTAHDAASSLGN